ncbi:MAG: Ig-like domain-containing protein [Pseudonocardiaceae bacterium]
MRKYTSAALFWSGAVVVAAAAGAVLIITGSALPTDETAHTAPPPATGQVTPTTTILTTSSASPVLAGTSVTLTATVTPAAPGTVQFRDGNANIGLAAPVRNGTASQVTSTLMIGPHQLTAMFTPANPALYGPSTSPVATFVISGATATNTTLTTASATPAVSGTSVTLTAAVTPPAAAGTVQFRYGATDIGAPVVVNNGTASTTTTTLPVGPLQLTALFNPTNTTLYSPSTSPAVPFTIAGATATTTTLSTSSAAMAVSGTSVTLNATVTPATAAGTVQFRDGATNIGAPATLTNGTASTTTTTLGVASHQLTAVFTPTDTTMYSASTSPAVTFAVAGASTTNTMLTTSPTSGVLPNTPVTLTAMLTPSAAAGTVRFMDATTNIGSAGVTNGTATATMTFAVGSHELTAVFTPTNTALYGPSTSQTVMFMVNNRSLLTVAPPQLGVGPQAPNGPGGPGTGARQPGRNNPLPGLGGNSGAPVALAGGSAIVLTRRWRKTRTR